MTRHLDAAVRGSVGSLCARRAWQASSARGIGRGEAKLNRKPIRWAVAGALSIGAAAPALAGSVTEPGETIGAATGAPAPPGLYFANTVNWGCRSTSPERTCSVVDIPVFVWSTPWKIFGARLQPSFAPIIPIEASIHNTANFSGLFNPFASGPTGLGSRQWMGRQLPARGVCRCGQLGRV